MTKRSSETTGAASAAPLATIKRNVVATVALADAWEKDAVDAIDALQDPDAAEHLLGQVTLAEQAVRIARLGKEWEDRWCVVRLKAVRRHGELMPRPEGKAEAGRKGGQAVTGSNRLVGAEKQMRDRARKVAAVPAEQFESYIATAKKPSLAGLLREAPPAGPRPQSKSQQQAYNNRHWENDEVVAWVARRMRAGRTRDEIFDESKAGEYDWPLPNRWLPKNTVDIVRAIVDDRKRRGDTTRRRGPSESGRRLRQLHEERRGGRQGELWELQVAIAQAVSGLEGFDLPTLDWSEDTEALVSDLFDDIERHVRWSEAALEVVTAHMGELGRQRKIQRLEARASDASSTPAERATAARLAHELKRKRKRLLSPS